MGVVVKLSPQRVRFARLLADAQSAPLRRGGNYTGLEEPDAYYIGILGEQAVAFLLRDNAARYETVIGQADSGDFDLTMLNGLTIKADVKTAGAAFHKHIMVPQVQAQRHTYPLYIACRLNGPDEVEVMGFLHPDEFLVNDEWHEVETKVPSVWQSFENILEVGWLLDRIAPGKLAEKHPREILEQLKAAGV